MPASSKAETLAQQARFIFKGTVQKLKAANMPGVPVNDRTAVVRVDEIIQAPEALSHYAGQEITVQLGGRKKLKKGQQAVFYTNGWLFGDGVAVQSIDHEDVKKAPAAFALAGDDPVKSLAARETQAHLNAAAVVVSGRVTSVRMPTDLVAARAIGGTESTSIGRISEHDPDWRIAEIQVDTVHKGEHKAKTATVRFPSSHDVMWHDAPKFQPGQEGFFMLHKADEGAAGVRAALVEDKGDYVAMYPGDFQPFDHPGGIKELLATSPDTPSSGADDH
jgi:hypothetical protein